MTSLFLLMAAVLIGSACLSIVETAILSLPLIRARMLVEQKRKNATVLLKIKQNIHLTIASIVIVNNAINISGSIFIGQKVNLLFGDAGLNFTAFFFPLMVIVIGEIIPKTLGERYKVTFALNAAKPVYVLVWVLAPIVKLILSLEKLFYKGAESSSPKVTEEEIKIMLKIGRDSGTVEMDEELLCTRVFKLNDLRAGQIMKSIDHMYTISANNTLEEIKDDVINSPFSRIAVYDKDPKDIVGIVQHRVLLREIAKDNYTAYVRDFMFQPIFVHQLTKADTLLQRFQETHQHLFIVKDNIGNDIGLVTMEDVLEELFGEIFDEKDIKPQPMVERNASQDYQI